MKNNNEAKKKNGFHIEPKKKGDQFTVYFKQWRLVNDLIIEGN